MHLIGWMDNAWFRWLRSYVGSGQQHAKLKRPAEDTQSLGWSYTRPIDTWTNRKVVQGNLCFFLYKHKNFYRYIFYIWININYEKFL